MLFNFLILYSGFKCYPSLPETNSFRISTRPFRDFILLLLVPHVKLPRGISGNYRLLKYRHS